MGATPGARGCINWGCARRRVYDGSLRMGILPVALFAGGHTFFAQRMAERAGREPYAVHATFQFSGTPGKRHRFRERMARPPLPRRTPQVPQGLLVGALCARGSLRGSCPLLTVVAANEHGRPL